MLKLLLFHYYFNFDTIILDSIISFIQIYAHVRTIPWFSIVDWLWISISRE